MKTSQRILTADRITKCASVVDEIHYVSFARCIPNERIMGLVVTACLSVRMFQLKKHSTNLDEIWCGRYTNGD
jgi:hypothetical protein